MPHNIDKLMHSMNMYVNVILVRAGADELSYSYTMACPHVRGDYPRALASGLSYVHVEKHGIPILYDPHEILRA